MSETKNLGKSPNLPWNIENMNGHDFENWMFNILTKIMKDYFKLGVTIEQTPGSGDNGKDIIIKSPISLNNIFFQNFSLKGKKEIIIYIECKSTNKPKLQFNSIISNVIKAKYDHIDYFVLITNSTIIPDTYYKIYFELKQHNIDFVLIDQFILSKTIHEKVDSNSDIPLSKEGIDFCGHYQIFPFKDSEGKTTLDVPILFRNYTFQNRIVTVKLFTDENWKMEENNYSIMLPPYGSGIKRFTFKHISYDGIEELKLYINNQKDESIIPIEGVNYKEVFIPHFTGDSHQQILQDLKEAISLSPKSNVYYLWGEAGIGKSRIIAELFKLLYGTEFDLKTVNLSSKVDNPTKIIQNYLIEKKYIKRPYNDFSNIILSASHEFRKAIIVIEDFHYANKEILNQIKSIDISNKPITLLICGRNDYSEGSLDYFSFIQWTLENHKETSWEVKPFSPEETENFIRIMINGIPNEVLSTIKTRSLNNPLYIVQYVEYLLDTNIVALQNRNTVGILNVDTFPTKNSIPIGINSIYKKRFNHLIGLSDKDNYLSIILLLTIYGGQISLDIINHYFELNNNEITELVKRRFIKFGSDKTIQFFHESLFIFFKSLLSNTKKYKRFIAEQIVNNSNVFFESLSNHEIGTLYIWLQKYNNAKKYFEPDAKTICNLSNYSNFNINVKLFEHLYDIYELYKIDNYDIAKKSLIIRIYMSLHHFSPMAAVNDCKKITNLIRKEKWIQDDETFINIINSLKAHALLNAGHLCDGELVLHELLSEYLVNPDKFDKQSLFDIVDRLASVYIKYNCYILANHYVKWELKIAEQVQREIGTTSLLAIAHRTRSKLFFFQNPKECLNSLNKVDKMSISESSERIYYSNVLSKYIYEMFYDNNCDWLNLNDEIESIRKKSIEKSFYRVLVRSDLLLSVCAIKLSENKTNLATARKIIEKGIDESIRLGIPGYIWQFYNLLAIVDTRLEYNINHLNQVFETIYAQLYKQNLLYIGNQELCFCNLLAISNVGAFLRNNFPESHFRRKMSNINYVGLVQSCNYNCENTQCNYICSKDNKYLNNQYELAEENKLLFTKENFFQNNINDLCLLRDDYTHYFIPIS